MKASVKMLMAAACGCAVLLFTCWYVICGRTVFSRGEFFSDAGRAVMADILRLSDSTAKGWGASAVHGTAIADRILAVADERERERLLEAFHDAVRRFPRDESSWSRRLAWMDAYGDLAKGVARGYGRTDARKSLDVRLEVLGTYLTELAAAWRTYGDVEGGRRKMSRAEWRDFLEYAYKLPDDYFAALLVFERNFVPRVRGDVSDGDWEAFRAKFRGIVGRGLRTPDDAWKMRVQLMEGLKGLGIRERWSRLMDEALRTAPRTGSVVPLGEARDERRRLGWKKVVE